HAHSRRVIHRDIKPSNVLVGTRAGKQTVKLADFGVARLLEQFGRRASLTLPQFATAPYAAPELLRDGETTIASDYYSFGVTLLAMLTLSQPEQPLRGEYLQEHIGMLSTAIGNTKAEK